MWAHESRTDLEPLRFLTHERSGVGSEKGLRENSSLSVFGLGFSRLQLLFCCVISFSFHVMFSWMAGHVVGFPLIGIPIPRFPIRIGFESHVSGRDKISSYPRASRSQCSGQNWFGLGAQTLEKPSEWRQSSIPLGPGLWARLHKYWASPDIKCWLNKALGSCYWAQLHSLGQSKTSGAYISVGRPWWPNSAVLEQFQKLHRFLNFAATFSQNEIVRFFQRAVISKITYLINQFIIN